MGGLGILFVIVFYLAISLLLVIQVKPILAKLAIFLIAVLLPTADAVYGRYKLKQMCEAEGGLKIYRVAHDVKGYLSTSSAADAYLVSKGVYEFSEAERIRGTYYRVFMQDGKLVTEDGVTPISKYQERFIRENRPEEYWRYTYQISTFPNGDEILAENTNIYFRGGWAEQFLAKFTGAGAGAVEACFKGSTGTRKFILSVLKP